jgi:DNA helicase-2/ATP-dependent DNA helicase PcrA
MRELSQIELSDLIGSKDAASVVAAAGCGKTEQIVLAVKHLWSIQMGSNSRFLILTHTNAGRDVLQSRLQKFDIPTRAYQLETIASWCVRYAMAYPITSGFRGGHPELKSQWSDVYAAASKLVGSGCIDKVLSASYQRIFVDEYQDCNLLQHDLLLELKKRLPICVFGDPLQAIFKFDGVVDWSKDVDPAFPLAANLMTPHRWETTGSKDLGAWISRQRQSLESNLPLDFSSLPIGVSQIDLPTADLERHAKISKACKAAMFLDGRVVVIHHSSSEAVRAAATSRLAKLGFSVVEKADCDELSRQAKLLGSANDGDRLSCVLNFLSKCATGIPKAEFTKSVISKRLGKNAGRKKFGDLIELGDRVDGQGGFGLILDFILEFGRRQKIYQYRRELFFSMVSALETVRSDPGVTLEDAVKDIKANGKRLGRWKSQRNVGSTLLVKGLEFEHSIIIQYPNMTREDWYVALTRATKSITLMTDGLTVFPAHSVGSTKAKSDTPEDARPPKAGDQYSLNWE